MASNMQDVMQTLNAVTDEISSNEDNWSAFLDSAARTYEFPFSNQVLIHAQKPDVTVCAEIPEWNKNNRFVKKGTSGIALLEERNQRRFLKYVYDVNDTHESNRGTSENNISRSISWGWEMQPEYEHVALVALQQVQSNEHKEAQFAPESEPPNSDALKMQLESVVKQLSRNIEPKSEHKEEVKRLLESSVAYVVMSRCNRESDEYVKDFFGINNLSRQEIRELGSAISKLSRRVLRLLEKSINSERRVNENEQNRVRESGRLFAPELNNSAEVEGTAREIRHDEEEFLGDRTSRPVPDTPSERPIAGAPDGDRRSGGRNVGADNVGVAENEPRAGQGNPSDGLGAAHEQPESLGRGNNTERADLFGREQQTGRAAGTGAGKTKQSVKHIAPQLSFDFNNLFPSEAEQKASIATPNNTESVNIREKQVNYDNALGKTIYLERDQPFIVTEIKPDYSEFGVLDTSTYVPITRLMRKKEFDFFAQYNKLNAHLFESAENIAEVSVISDEQAKEVDINESKENDKNPQVTTTSEYTPRPTPVNFRITDEHLGVGGAKTKYNFNVTAIKLLKQLEGENRLATSEEQQVLSKYVGWGGIPQAFDKDKSDWNKEYEELRTLLTDEEYEAARASTLNAHYTSPTVINAIYKGIENMGFAKGNILEPSIGVGNFFGLLPESMEQSKLYGVELDSVTGRIAKQLYQDAKITVSGYEKTALPDNFFDVAIGNVPFGHYKVQDSKYDKHNFRIHDYFFAKSLDQVRPGGVVAFVTSKGTLDKA